MKMSNHTTRKPNRGFTLVEVLTVIVIIGILAAISIPAIQIAVRKTKQGAQAVELSNLGRQIEQYALKYGDYPPDGSNEAVFKRHMRKLFPRMAEPDLTILSRLTDDSDDPDVDITTTNFSGVAMDRGEALVFFLGGFSSDIQNPLTGPGGPLEFKDYLNDGDTDNLDNYQYNTDRDNALFDFEPSRLTIARASETAPLESTDEVEMGTDDANHGGIDLLPAYRAVADEPAPIVYFDSRTYGVIDSSVTPIVYNGFYADSVGGIRPYKTELGIEPPPTGGYSGTAAEQEAAAFAAVKFHNPDTFQIITPGLDGLFGSVVSSTPGNTSAQLNAYPTIHFVTESGRPVQPNRNATSIDDLYFKDQRLGSKGFQDQDWGALDVNAHLDNITNFSTSILESGLE